MAREVCWGKYLRKGGPLTNTLAGLEVSDHASYRTHNCGTVGLADPSQVKCIPFW